MTCTLLYGALSEIPAMVFVSVLGFGVVQLKITDILTWGYFGKALRDATSIYNFKITTKFVDDVGDNVNVRVSPPHRPCCVVAVRSGGGAAEGGAGVVAPIFGGC
jgi:hypothetical protein